MHTFILTLGADPEILPTEVVAMEGSIFFDKKVAVREGAWLAAVELSILLGLLCPVVDEVILEPDEAGGTMGEPVAVVVVVGVAAPPRGFFGGEG